MGNRRIVRIGDRNLPDGKFAKVIVGRNKTDKSLFYLWINFVPRADPYKEDENVEFLVVEGRLSFSQKLADAHTFNKISTALLYIENLKI